MNPYLSRRTHLIQSMHSRGGGVAIIPTAPEVMRNRDNDYPYRHDSYFYYLSGFTEPESVIVLIADNYTHTSRTLLFCREKNITREIWDGYRHGPEAACTEFGFDEAFPISTLDAKMSSLLSDAAALFYGLGQYPELDQKIHAWLTHIRTQARTGATPPAVLYDIRTILDEMRLLKDSDEISLMRHAAIISAQAHSRTMRITRPGLYEYQLEAEILHEFKQHGAQSPAYSSIVASGAHACTLHYRANNDQLKEGDLVLIDAGCEFNSYASDITRTFPINGTFSEPQKILYELVLAAQHAAIEETRPGKRFIDGHNAAVRVLAEGMLDIGLLNKKQYGTIENVLAEQAYQSFYMHRTGHWLGLDVHDVGSYRSFLQEQSERQEKPWRVLQPGMTLTVEPGIYVRPAENVPEAFWNIGIRIEDDALVTEQGCDILSKMAPKTISEIELVMKR